MDASQSNVLPSSVKPGQPAVSGFRDQAFLLLRRWAFNAAYLVVLSLATPWLVMRSLRNGRYRKGGGDGLATKLFGVRKSQLALLSRLRGTHPHKAREVVWLHGVSVGEVQLLAALHQNWKSFEPDTQFVISTTTASGMELAQRSFPDADVVYFPWDFSWGVQRTIKAIRPSLLVLGELELWPNMIEACRTQNVPVSVVNGRLSERSFRGYHRLSFITRRMFQQVSLVLAQTQEYADRFVASGCLPHQVKNVGGLKFDNASFNRCADPILHLRALVGLDAATNDPVVVVGSTQSPEEEGALRALEHVRESCPEARMIIVPRHPDRFESVHAILNESSFRVVRRSQLATPIATCDWEVLLVDTIGELRWWWGLADVAIVGGSFGKRGGQNMIEPSAFGCNVAVGPNTSNFRDVVQSLKDAGAITVLPNLETLPEWLAGQLSNSEPGRLRGAAARELVRRQQGATERTLEALSELLERQRSAPIDEAANPDSGHPVSSAA